MIRERNGRTERAQMICPACNFDYGKRLTPADCLTIDDVTALLDPWLGKVLAPHRIKQTIADIAAAAGSESDAPAAALLRAKAKAAECRTKLARHRAVLETGADPVTVSRWIAETNAELAGAEAQMSAAATQGTPAPDLENMRNSSPRSAA